MPGQNAHSLGLTGRERFSINGSGDPSGLMVTVVALPDDGGKPVTRALAKLLEEYLARVLQPVRESFLKRRYDVVAGR